MASFFESLFRLQGVFIYVIVVAGVYKKQVFSDEVVRYMDSKIDKAIFPALLGGIAEIMIREKKGHPDLINELLN